MKPSSPDTDRSAGISCTPHARTRGPADDTQRDHPHHERTATPRRLLPAGRRRPI